MVRYSRLLGAILLVSGTTIGAGMLALPVTTGLAGFFPALFIMAVVWLLMLLTAFYLVEVALSMPEGSNLISMMRLTYGRGGALFTWGVYLFLLYALMAAYLLGAAGLLAGFLQPLLPFSLPNWGWTALLFLCFGLFIYLGIPLIDGVNRLLMSGLALSYILLISVGCCHISPPFLTHVNWHFLAPSLSLVLTSFGYHIIIPSLVTYLRRETKQIITALIIGSLIPFVVYLLWQLLVMGVIPVEGPKSLTEAAKRGDQVTFFLTEWLKNPWIGLAARSFAFFAIVTSLLGVSLALADFLADGLKISKTAVGKLQLILLTLLPPLFFALFYPQGFILALHYAGIAVVILLALIPVLMVWRVRSMREEKHLDTFRVAGGKPLLVAVLFFSCVLLTLEVIR